MIDTPGGVGGDEHLGEAVAGAAGDEEVARPGPADSTGRFTPSRTTSSPSTRISSADLAEVGRAGGARRSTTWRSSCRRAARRARSACAPLIARSLSARGDDVGAHRAGRARRGAELVGHQVRSTRPSPLIVPPPCCLADQQRRPARARRPAASSRDRSRRRRRAAAGARRPGRAPARNLAVVSRKNSWSELSCQGMCRSILRVRTARRQTRTAIPKA